MLDATTAVANAIRSSEKVQLVIDTNPGGGGRSPLATGQTRGSSVQSTRRVIAIITRENDGKEHGGLFIYKWTREEPPSLVLVTTLAMTSDLRVDIALLTSNLSSATAGHAIPAPRADCVVDVHSDGMEFSFVCEQAKATQLKEESERLKTFGGFESEPSAQTHSWMAAYAPDAGDRRLISRLARPHDLRVLYRGPALSSGFAGSPGDEDADAVLIRDDWIRKTVHSRKDMYSTPHQLRVRVGTFNVNGKNPDASIRMWVQGDRKDTDGPLEDPDIFLFGFQELDLSTGALLYSTSTLLEGTWTEAILSALGAKAGLYVKFASHQLVGMLVLGFVRRGQRPYISEISTGPAGVGIMGMLGNKGAVAMRFRFRNTLFTCVASHLAANDGMVEKRNSDYREIIRRLQFPLKPATPAEAAEQLHPVSSSIFESDVLIWIGDLNYRIEIPYEEVMEMTRPPTKPYNIPVLMEFDELTVSKSRHLAFELFEENPITFSPTYRYFVHTKRLDIMRRPAWTDRILHMSYPPTSVKQTSYSSHPDILFSDHKPVSADFTIETRTVDPELHSKAITDVLRVIRHFGTSPDSPPRLQVNSKLISFGEIRYMQPVTQTLEISNPGSIPCAFRLLPPEEGGTTSKLTNIAISLSELLAAPGWLSADIQYGLLLPSEKVTVTLTTLVDNSVAKKLEPKARDLEATVIIHAEHGLDHFIAANATLQPSCFSKSLDFLVHLPKSVRESDGMETLRGTQAVNIPRELMRMVDRLMTHPLTSRFDELFAASSPPDLLWQIREALDTGGEFVNRNSSLWGEDDVTLAFGETLVQFLDSLVEPVVPTEVHPLIANLDGEQDGEFLDALPHISVNVWVTLFAFLQFVCNQSGATTPEIDHADRIAAIFAPVLIRDEPAEDGHTLTPLQKRNFVKRFLVI